jgi:hypothetical protein
LQADVVDKVRRHGDHCDDVVKLTKDLNPHKHTFDNCPGTITVQWINDKGDDHMLVACEVNTETDPAKVTHNLYNSQTGENFLPSTTDSSVASKCPAHADLSLVGDVVFSEIPQGLNTHRFAYATPMQQVTNNDEKYVWISKDWGKTFSCHTTPRLFETLLPHPKKHGWFLATADNKYVFFFRLGGKDAWADVGSVLLSKICGGSDATSTAAAVPWLSDLAHCDSTCI